jgi:hypothetical protein
MALPGRNSYNSPEQQNPAILMEDYFKKISKILSRAALTERERTDMRLQLAAFIDEHPATAPFSIRMRSRVSNLFGSSHAHFAIRAVASAFVLVMVAGVGTSYAAETALPGQPLYAVKINVDEPVERATVASSDSQAQWELTLANRRLEEAEKLAASGSLTPASAAIVETQLNTDTQDYDQSVATDATSSSDAAQVADAQSDLEAALSAHVAVLSALASSTPEEQDQQDPIASIMASVRTHAAQASAARIAALDTFDADATTTTLRLATAGEMRAAATGLASVRALARAAFASNASSSAAIDTDASTTAQAIAVGSTNLAKGHFKQAFSAFQAAVRSATEVQVSAQAQADLGTSVTIPAISQIVPQGAEDTATSTSDVDETDEVTATSTTATTTSAVEDPDDTSSSVDGINPSTGN